MLTDRRTSDDRKTWCLRRLLTAERYNNIRFDQHSCRLPWTSLCNVFSGTQRNRGARRYAPGKKTASGHDRCDGVTCSRSLLSTPISRRQDESVTDRSASTSLYVGLMASLWVATTGWVAPTQTYSIPSPWGSSWPGGIGGTMKLPRAIPSPNRYRSALYKH